MTLSEMVRTHELIIKLHRGLASYYKPYAARVRLNTSLDGAYNKAEYNYSGNN